MNTADAHTLTDALTAADAIAAALSDPRTAWAATPPGERAWPQSLAGGAAGIALLHIERARSGHGDWNTAHSWLASAAADDLTAAANAGLYLGAPAVAFAVHAAAGSTRRYRRALTALDDATVMVTRKRLADAHARIDRGERPALKEFDLIRGLAGLGVYHLRRHPEHDITRDVLTYLIRLTEPLPLGGGLPPWWTDVSPNGEPSPDYSGGHGNFGLSHGIGAVLALLSLALLRGLSIPGCHEAIARICAYTDQWRQHDGAGPWWPGFITAEHVRNRSVAVLRPRPSWCYGIAGTARVQQLAGMALEDTARQHAAETGMLAALRDQAQLELLGDEIGLCHGTAGLLQAAWRVAADAHIPEVAAELPRLTARLIAQVAQPLPDPGLLDGAAGAALALHTLGTGTAPATGWDSFLLLA
ncbi:hypothetical protein Acsp04_62970 [Actinomadura sp. NBRC 104425]|uniref:lanthionine synthetase C family protein n=1 Tax=Actinomadura sp. NBRC 104425 TaxID=3032204 RepID=UPI0024A4B8D1|nr:lanthionine synthetase C family protein [Actinomadura sp. NBRC 104425]GLZ16062.1 hypothetical protein Acsp04_62970 [Actinomadura sp. NBRC 104425]